MLKTLLKAFFTSLAICTPLFAGVLFFYHTASTTPATQTFGDTVDTIDAFKKSGNSILARDSDADIGWDGTATTSSKFSYESSSHLLTLNNLTVTGTCTGCGGGAGTSNFSGLDFSVIGGNQVKISSQSFDNNSFVLSNTASQGFVRTNWGVGGVASRSTQNTWTAGASFSAGLEVTGASSYASISNTAWISPPGFSGNVGIGTSSPAAKLDVTGTGSISTSLAIGGSLLSATQLSVTTSAIALTAVQSTGTANYGGYRSYNNNGTGAFLLTSSWGSASGTTLFGQSSNNMQVIQSDGANSTGLLIGTATSDPLIFGTNNTAALTVDTSQNIGIGKSVPLTKFDVNGTASVSFENAVTTTSTNMLALNHASTGTPAAGFGTGLLFQGESSTTASRSMGGINATWVTATDASRQSALNFAVHAANMGGFVNIWRMSERTPCCNSMAALGPTADLTTYMGMEAGHLYYVFSGNYSYDISNGAILMGATSAASPITQSIKASSGSGSDIRGSDLVLAAGAGTGLAQGGSLSFQTSSPATTGSTANTRQTRMVISRGNVGIGKIAPTATLDIVGSSSFSPFNVASASGTSLFTVAKNGAITVLQGALIGNSGGSNSKISLSDAAGTLINYGGNQITLGSSAITIAATGGHGSIGSDATSPYMTPPDGVLVRFQSNAATTGARISTSTAAPLEIGTNGTPYLTFGSAGGASLSTNFELTGTASISGTTTFKGVTYTWPSTQGGASTVLTNNGSGVLSWAAAGGGLSNPLVLAANQLVTSASFNWQWGKADNFGMGNLRAGRQLVGGNDPNGFIQMGWLNGSGFGLIASTSSSGKPGLDFNVIGGHTYTSGQTAGGLNLEAGSYLGTLGSGDGGPVSIIGGTASASNGGSVDISGGSDVHAGGAAGDVTLTGGSSGGAGSQAGSVSITGGSVSGGGTPGGINMTVTAPGRIAITGNASTSGNFEISNGTASRLGINAGGRTDTMFEISGNASMSYPSAGLTEDALCTPGASGAITRNAGATTCLVSGKQYKDNIKPLNGSLDEVLKLIPRSYTNKGKDVQNIGFIAQEVEKVDPRLVFYEDDGKTPRGVKYEQMAALFAGAIQEQQAQIDALKKDKSLGGADGIPGTSSGPGWYGLLGLIGLAPLITKKRINIIKNLWNTP